MDNITHTLIGVSLANAGLKQRLGRGTTWALAISSNIPDIDVFWGFIQHDHSFVYRRMFTHSVLGLPFLSMALALLFHRVFKNLSLKTSFGLCFLGSSLHVLYDLMNSYGVVVMYPFSHRRFELGWIFIIDLVIWAVLAGPLLLSLFSKFRPHLRQWSTWAVVTLGSYTALCGLSRLRASQLLSGWVRAQNQTASFTYVFPEALGPHRFRGVARIGNTYHVHLIHTLTGKLSNTTMVTTEDDSDEVRQIKESIPGKKVDWFFKAPVWKKEPNSDVWDVSDLRFQSTVIGRKMPFVYRFELENGQVRQRN